MVFLQKQAKLISFCTNINFSVRKVKKSGGKIDFCGYSLYNIFGKFNKGGKHL